MDCENDHIKNKMRTEHSDLMSASLGTREEDPQRTGARTDRKTRANPKTPYKMKRKREYALDDKSQPTLKHSTKSRELITGSTEAEAHETEAKKKLPPA